MTGPVSPGRARHRLLARLEAECAQRYSMSTLHGAVLDSYKLGEQAIPLLLGDVLATMGNFRRTETPGVFTSSDGKTLSIECGRSVMASGDYGVSITDVFSNLEERTFAEESLRSPGRYEFVTGAAPPDMGATLEQLVH